jgi:hypothetical protein
LVAVALNVTGVPAHTGLDEEFISTLATSRELTVIVIPGEVAGLPVTQTALEVITHVTTSPLDGVYE